MKTVENSTKKSGKINYRIFFYVFRNIMLLQQEFLQLSLELEPL